MFQGANSAPIFIAQIPKRKYSMRLLKVILMASGFACATPMIYTFSGNLGGATSDIIDDRAQSGIFWSNNVSKNAQFTYQILVDFDRQGIIVQPDGTESLNPQNGNPAYSFYYAEYVSGDLVPDLFHGRMMVPGDPIGSYRPPRRTTIDKFGVDLIGTTTSKVFVNSSLWTDISFVNWSKFAGDWQVGDTFTLFENFQNPYFIEWGGGFSRQATLTDITPASIPEPSSWYLMIAGFFSFVLFGRRRIKQG
jgi:hypothetical protein